jgi:nucleoside phosphorylase/CheY-like chemotaxis protein
MLKILLVDDAVEKAGRITRVLLTIPGVDREHIEHVTSLHTARQKLQSTVYDLLLLDIFVPNHIDEDPLPDGGLRLLAEIQGRPERFRTPTHVIGITQYEQIHSQATEQFRESTLAVLLYDRSTDAWERTLVAAVQHSVAAKAAMRESRIDAYTSALAITCALPLELEAVRRLPWNWDADVYRVPGDPTAYFRGWIDKRGDRRPVYAAAAPRMGMPATAVLATKMIIHFRPEVIAMTGITAGIRGKVSLGDVIVADPAWDYGSGKWIEGDAGADFEVAPHQLGLDATVRTAIGLLAEDTIGLNKIRADWPGDKPPHPLTVHVGPLASGAAVLASGGITDSVVAQHRKTLGVEMEAYALYVAAQEAALPKPRALALKSVVDFADPNKGDSYQRYGAYASAAVLRYALEVLL